MKCPICELRISQWMMGKTTLFGEHHVHNSCLQDFKLRHGKDWSLWEISQELLGGGKSPTLKFVNNDKDQDGA